MLQSLEFEVGTLITVGNLKKYGIFRLSRTMNALVLQ